VIEKAKYINRRRTLQQVMVEMWDCEQRQELEKRRLYHRTNEVMKDIKFVEREEKK
jgi:hypothetical protein